MSARWLGRGSPTFWRTWLPGLRHHEAVEVGGFVEGAAFLQATGGPVEPGLLGE